MYFYFMARICFFNSVRFWGGGEKLHLDNALGFRNLGYDVVIACDKESILWKRATDAGLPCIHVRVRNLTFLNPFAMRNISSMFRNENIDTVIFTTSQDVKAGAIAAKRAGVERIVYLRGLAVPVKNNAVNRKLFTRTLTHIIANSQETKRLMLQHLNQVPGIKHVDVVYHGIELPQQQHASKLPEIAKVAKGIILGNAGRLTKQKGQEFLIALAEDLREKNIEFTLFIAGEGEERETLASLIKQKGLQQHVIMLGFVSDMDLFMHSIDIFLLTSTWEGFGFVLVEAMAHKKPVVAFNISSNPEIVEQGKTGFLIEPGNMQSFSDAVLKLVNDAALRQKFGEEGMNRVVANFIFQNRVNELARKIFA